MKRIITTFAIALLTIISYAQTNPVTGNILQETMGIYSVKTSTGIIPLGDLKTSRNFLAKADKCFIQESLDLGTPDFKVGKDSTGLYIFRLGLGAAKLRPSDVTLFLTILEGKIVGSKAKECWKVITR